jgi:hypothetical protein
MQRWVAFLLALGLCWPAWADMYPDASNAKLPDARINILPKPATAGKCLAGNGIDWVATDCTTSGTWVPALKFGGNAVGLACSSCTGTYTVAGKQVMFQFQVQLSAKGTSTGAATVTGLPTPASVPVSPAGMVTCGYYSSMSGMPNSLVGYVQAGGVVINLELGSATVMNPPADTNFTAASFISCGGSYPIP